MTPWEKAEEWLRPSRFAMFLAAFVILQFPNIFVGSETFFFRDFGFFGYPLAAYHRDSFWQGELPFWNPYNNAGLPFLAQWNTMVLYPGSFIYLLLPMPWGLNLFCLAHQFLAGLGMYFLGRSSAKSNLAGAIAAMAFAFSGLILSSLKWPNNIAAFGLMPWVVWKCLRAIEKPAPARVVLAALLGAVQMLSGAPEVILLTWTIIGVLGLAESIRQKRALPLLALAAIVTIVAILAAAQLLPFLDLLKHSQRTAKFAGSDWPMPIWGWLNFLQPLYGSFPSYHGVPAQPNQYWISTYYVPLAAVAFAMLALRQPGRPRLLAALALAGAVLALGEPGKVYSFVREVFPPIGFMRFPIKFVVLPVFLLAWLSAYGVRVIFNNVYCENSPLESGAGAPHSKTLARLRTPHPNFREVLECGAPAPLSKASVSHQSQAQPDSSPLQNIRSQKFWMPACSLTSACALIYLFAPSFDGFRGYAMLPAALVIAFAMVLSWFTRCVRPALFAVALLAAIWLDAKFHAPQQNPSVPKWVFDRNILEFADPPRAGQGRAMLSSEAALKMDHLMFDTPEKDIVATRLALFCNANLIDRIPKIDGFFSLYLRESQQLIDLIYANTNRSFPGLEKLLKVSHRTAPGKTTEWTTNETAGLPWITFGQTAAFADAAQTVRAITADDFDPAATIYLPTNAPAIIGGSGARIGGGPEFWTPNKIAFDVKANSPGWLFISQAFHHNWRATLNGAPIKIERANYAFQGMLAPVGGRIQLTYEDRAFQIGLLLSFVGLLAAWIPIRKRA